MWYVIVGGSTIVVSSVVDTIKPTSVAASGYACPKKWNKLIQIVLSWECALDVELTLFVQEVFALPAKMSKDFQMP